MRWIDVSMPLSVGMAAFPGDPEFRSVPQHSIARGDAYNVSALALGSHAGTHLDPPRHFLPDGVPTDRLDPVAFNGPCAVVGVEDGRTRVTAEDVERIPAGVERAVFRTSNSARWAHRPGFFPQYVALDPEAAEAVVARRLRLVGIDALSIELDVTGTFPVHHRLLGAGTLILEGLLLADALPGLYELRCLPLRLHDGDGGPARAFLLAR